MSYRPDITKNTNAILTKLLGTLYQRFEKGEDDQRFIYYSRFQLKQEYDRTAMQNYRYFKCYEHLVGCHHHNDLESWMPILDPPIALVLAKYVLTCLRGIVLESLASILLQIKRLFGCSGQRRRRI
jgi:hypothetical protein